ncbi:hypothetical protein EVAR_54096_1 [Eumeta japonica]|uniref:Uncharacterized protein n=1 Tax=Eumeta variegata TaxID=151549 RepID=A0A4C1Z4P5_EUMVA|nr:hypothetical protein EVAR_54096_1 [Eumeta japonica]
MIKGYVSDRAKDMGVPSFWPGERRRQVRFFSRGEQSKTRVRTALSESYDGGEIYLVAAAGESRRGQWTGDAPDTHRALGVGAVGARRCDEDPPISTF